MMLDDVLETGGVETVPAGWDLDGRVETDGFETDGAFFVDNQGVRMEHGGPDRWEMSGRGLLQCVHQFIYNGVQELTEIRARIIGRMNVVQHLVWNIDPQLNHPLFRQKNLLDSLKIFYHPLFIK